MNRKIMLLSLFTLVASVQAADDKVSNDIIPTYCGVNILEGAWVGEVCLGEVVGYQRLEVLQTRDTDGKVTAAPIIKRTVLKNTKKLSVEKFVITTGNTVERGVRNALATEEVTLTIRLTSNKGEPIYTRSIEGKDGNGRPFQADLEGVVHAQVGGSDE